MFVESTAHPIENLIKLLLDDSKWSDGKELERLAGEYWEARKAHDDGKARAVWAAMGDVNPKREKRTLENGNTFYSVTIPDESGHGHYQFSFGPDWERMDTPQDAFYFGVWTNTAAHQIFSYTEGDCGLEVAPDAETCSAAHKAAQRYYYEQYYEDPEAAMLENGIIA